MIKLREELKRIKRELEHRGLFGGWVVNCYVICYQALLENELDTVKECYGKIYKHAVRLGVSVVPYKELMKMDDELVEDSVSDSGEELFEEVVEDSEIEETEIEEIEIPEHMKEIQAGMVTDPLDKSKGYGKNKKFIKDNGSSINDDVEFSTVSYDNKNNLEDDFEDIVEDEDDFTHFTSENSENLFQTSEFLGVGDFDDLFSDSNEWESLFESSESEFKNEGLFGGELSNYRKIRSYANAKTVISTLSDAVFSLLKMLSGAWLLVLLVLSFYDFGFMAEFSYHFTKPFLLSFIAISIVSIVLSLLSSLVGYLRQKEERKTWRA